MSYNYLGANNMIQSGGGDWHPENGPYGIHSERTDVFGDSRPVAGQAYGNMYNIGSSYLESHNAGARDSQDIRLPYEFVPRSEVERDTWARGVGNNYGHHPLVQQAAPLRCDLEAIKNKKEGFAAPTTKLDDIDYDIVEPEPDSPDKKISRKKWVIVVLAILFFIMVAYWVKTTDSLMMEYVFKHIRPTNLQLVITTLIMTVVFLIILFLVSKYA